MPQESSCGANRWVNDIFLSAICMFKAKSFFISIFYVSFSFLPSQALALQSDISFSDGKIHICHGEHCENFKIPSGVDMELDGKLELRNIDDEPGDEILFTTSSDVNECSTVFYIDRSDIDSSHREIKEYSGARDICNFDKIADGMIVSNYRDGAMWRQDLIRVKNKNLELVFSDSCLECEQVRRDMVIGGDVKKILVNKSDNILDRKQIQGVVVADKATIAASPQALMGSKSYLIKGDKVLLVDSSIESNNQFFFLIDYKGKSGKVITRWIRCEDLDVCN